MTELNTIQDEETDLRAGLAVRGRGTGALAKGRFERLETAYAGGEAQQVETEVFRDASRSIISYNDSPDVGFSASLNPYRGCEHGCIYCYARPSHEYFGLSAGLDFETKIFAKPDAPALLRRELQSPKWQPQVLAMSGITDCYQPVERKLEITRSCLAVLAEYRNPVVIITKNYLVTRDIDYLAELAKYNAAHVTVSVTSLDAGLARSLEPRASTPTLRLKAIEALSKAGIHVSANIAPIIPGLTDHEIPALLKAAADAGAKGAHYTMVRLPYSVKDLFKSWLEQHFPDRASKVLNRIREVRGGKLNSSEFGDRMIGEGIYAEHIRQMFYTARRQAGLNRRSAGLSTAHFRRTGGVQLSLL